MAGQGRWSCAFQKCGQIVCHSDLCILFAVHAALLQDRICLALRLSSMYALSAARNAKDGLQIRLEDAAVEIPVFSRMIVLHGTEILMKMTFFFFGK